jgi:nicotinamidase-related amidase
MTEPFTLAPGRAALDVVDMQDDFVARPGAAKPEELEIVKFGYATLRKLAMKFARVETAARVRSALHAPVVGTEGAR